MEAYDVGVKKVKVIGDHESYYGEQNQRRRAMNGMWK